MDRSKSDADMYEDGMECEADGVEEKSNEENSYDDVNSVAEGEENGGSGFDGGVSDGGGESEVASALSIEQRLELVERRLEGVCLALQVVGERLGDLITLNNHQFDAKNGKREVVTALVFEGYVDEAISSGHAFGVSRSFIQEYITKTYALPCNKYLQRRIGSTLRRKVSEKIYKLESNLYSFEKEQAKKNDSE